MVKLYRYLQVILALTLLAGCAKKEIYKFNQPLGSFGQVEKVKQKQAPGEGKEGFEFYPAPDAAVPEEVITFNASRESLIPLKAIQTNASSRISYLTESKQELDQPAAAKVFRKVNKPVIIKDKKKFFENPGGKPVHKLAYLGIAFSLFAVALHVIGLPITGIGGIFLIAAFLGAIAGIVLSALGLKRIKRNPESYSGKGYAWAGLILGSLQLLLYVLFIIFVMAWAGAFS